MSLNSNQSLESLTANLAQLKKLSREDTINHAAEISSILLWIARNHPNVFEGNAEKLQGVYVKSLYFSNSWEFPDELVPTDVLKNLLRIYDIKRICGYIDLCALKHLDEQPLDTVRLALGRHINVRLLIEELNCRRIRHVRKREHLTEDNIMIHLRCGELDLEDLAPLPNIEPTLYISDVGDQDASWVVQAATALRPKPMHKEYPHMQEPYFRALKLPRSKLTSAGVEAIAKGLFDIHVIVEELEVSSPHFAEHEYEEEGEDEEEEIPGYEEFGTMISEKYNTICSFNNDKGMGFTEIKDNIFDDSDDGFGYGYGY